MLDWLLCPPSWCPGPGTDGHVVHAGRPTLHVRRPEEHQAGVQGYPDQQGSHQAGPGIYMGLSYATVL